MGRATTAKKNGAQRPTATLPAQLVAVVTATVAAVDIAMAVVAKALSGTQARTVMTALSTAIAKATARATAAAIAALVLPETVAAAAAAARGAKIAQVAGLAAAVGAKHNRAGMGAPTESLLAEIPRANTVKETTKANVVADGEREGDLVRAELNYPEPFRAEQSNAAVAAAVD